MRIRSYDIQHIGCILFLVYIFLYDLSNALLGNWVSLIVVILAEALCFASIQKGEQRYKVPKIYLKKILPWLFFALLFVIPRNQLAARNIYFSTIRWLMAVLLMCMIAYKNEEYEHITRSICVIGFLHVLATWVLYFVPSLYKGLYKIWGEWPVGTAKGQLVYKAGLTGHYSRSAIALISVLLILTAAVTVYLQKKEMATRFTFTRTAVTAALFVLTLGALFLTAKRSALLFGLGAMVLGYVAYGNKKNSFLRLVVIMAAMLAAVLILSRFLAPVRIVIDRFLELGSDSSTINRLKMWRIALELFAEHPVIGIGWEGFKYQYYLKIGAQSAGAYDFLDAHNVYLQVLAETGITGFALYCFCVFSTFMTTLKLLKAKDRIARDADKIAVLYAFMYQVYYILYCVTGNCLYDITFVHYAIAIGLVYGVYTKTVMAGKTDPYRVKAAAFQNAMKTNSIKINAM